MSAGDRIIVGLPVGRLVPQPGWSFTTTEKGFDTGQVSFTTHWNTNQQVWPKKGDPAPGYPFMFAVEVTRRDHESTGCRDFDVTYRGLKAAAVGGGVFKLKQAISTNIWTLIVSSGTPGVAGLYVGVSTPRLSEDYVTTSYPSKAGLGGHIDKPSGDFPDTVTATYPDGTVVPYDCFWILATREVERVSDDPPLNLWAVRDVKTCHPIRPAS